MYALEDKYSYPMHQITLLNKLYRILGFITVMSIRTKFASVCASLKLTVTSIG